MTVYTVHHTTAYRYRRPVTIGEHRMLLRPREGRDQRLLDMDLTITPEPTSLTWSRDPFDNDVAAARFADRTEELRFESFVRVEVSPSHPGGFAIAHDARILPIAFDPDEEPDLQPYLHPTYSDPDGVVEAWAKASLNDGRPTSSFDVLGALNERVRREFTYMRRSEEGTQTPAETVASGAGTCRDFTVLMMEAARALGFPARFVSGYLYVPDRDSHAIHGGGATHAWAQVYVPGAGWIDFDPTNAIIANDGLIRVAVARRPRQAVPLFGSFAGSPSDDLGMTVTVVVRREGSFAMELRRGLQA
jgi:transglutaminase-like putative cysteine protease